MEESVHGTLVLGQGRHGLKDAATRRQSATLALQNHTGYAESKHTGR